MLVPTTVKETPRGNYSFDLYSRLLDDRIVMLDAQVTDESASLVVAQLLYLAAKDADADIQLYVNSPGGSVSAGLAIVDAMDLVPCDVATTAMGLAASMGSVILAHGARGKRRVLPNAEVLIHQVLGGTSGQQSDVEIAAAHMREIRERLTRILSADTGKPYDDVYADTERDRWLTAEEAVAYGLADEVLRP